MLDHLPAGLLFIDCCDITSVSDKCPLGVVGGAPGKSGPVRAVTKQASASEVFKTFLLNELLSDRDMAAEMEAGRGAATYDMSSYLVSLHLAVTYFSSHSGP